MGIALTCARGLRQPYHGCPSPLTEPAGPTNAVCHRRRTANVDQALARRPRWNRFASDHWSNAPLNAVCHRMRSKVKIFRPLGTPHCHAARWPGPIPWVYRVPRLVAAGAAPDVDGPGYIQHWARAEPSRCGAASVGILPNDLGVVEDQVFSCCGPSTTRAVCRPGARKNCVTRSRMPSYLPSGLSLLFNFFHCRVQPA